MRSFDDVLQEIGAFGKYQKIICVLLVLSTVPNGFWAMVSIFSHYTPPHHCRLPQLDNFTQIKASQAGYLNFQLRLPQYLYGLGAISALAKCPRPYGEAGQYNGTFEWNGTDIVLPKESKQIMCDRGWSYKVEQSTLTITNEWDLVCSQAWLRPLALSLFMAGILVGSFVSGILADRYGRRPVFLWGTFIQFFSIVLISFSTDILMYCVCFFVSGLTGFVNYVAAFVIGTEISNSSKRAFMGVLEVAGFTLGYMILPILAYFIHDWRTLYRVVGFSGVLFVPYYWLIPESPRWLLKAGRIEEAMKVIKIIAKVNGKPLEDDHSIFRRNPKKSLLKISKEDEDAATNLTYIKKYTYIDLFLHRATRGRTVIMSLLWFVSSLVYYCISLNTHNLGGNNYVVCFAAAAVELPAYLFMYVLAEKAGRRSCLAILLTASATCCLISPFIRQAGDILTIVVAMFGKFAISGAFALDFIYCCEIFPTMMRNMGLGSSSTMARVGAIISPYLVFAGEEIDKTMPFIVMGILGFVAALSTFCLPETKSLNLPQTLEDALAQERYLPVLVQQCFGRLDTNADLTESKGCHDSSVNVSNKVIQ